MHLYHRVRWAQTMEEHREERQTSSKDGGTNSEAKNFRWHFGTAARIRCQSLGDGKESVDYKHVNKKSAPRLFLRFVTAKQEVEEILLLPDEDVRGIRNT